MENELVIKEIDNMHVLANEALENKKLDSYMLLFGDELQYNQFNGKTINKKKLRTDVNNYIARICSFSNTHQRINFKIENNTLIERVIQHVKISLRIFIFFSKKWTIEREAIYEWKKVDEAWRIVKVEIIKEKVY